MIKIPNIDLCATRANIHSNKYAHLHASHPLQTKTQTIEKQLCETKAWNRRLRATGDPAGYLQVHRDGVSCLSCIVKYLSVYLKPQLLTHSELSLLLQTLSEEHLPLSKHTQSRKRVNQCNHTCADPSNHTCADTYNHTCADPSNRLLREQYSLFPISRTGIRVGCLFSLFNQSQEQSLLQKCHLLNMLRGAKLGEASSVAPRVEPPTNQAFRHSKLSWHPWIIHLSETSRTPAEARTVSAIWCYIFSSG